MQRILLLVTGLACAYAPCQSFAQIKPNHNGIGTPTIAQPGPKLGQPHLTAGEKVPGGKADDLQRQIKRDEAARLQTGRVGGKNDPLLKQIKKEETARKGGEKGSKDDPKLKMDLEKARLQASAKGGKPEKTKNQ